MQLGSTKRNMVSLVHISTVFVLLLETQRVSCLWGNVKVVESNLDRTIRTIDNRITASETAYQSVIEANDLKTQAVIKANNDITDVRITVIVDGFTMLGTKIDSLKNETSAKLDNVKTDIDELKTFKTIANFGWTAVVAVFGSLLALGLQFVAKRMGLG
jgi:hypothetical protein